VNENPSPATPLPQGERGEESAPAWRWFLLGFVAPAVFLFWDVIAKDRNFAYRDAGHFYYPYYKLIAQEWSAGRVPLWNPYENGGEPLAAQPTAAVWYPGKLFFLLPYPLAFKVYHLGHIVLAWWSAFWCARMLGVSRGAAAFAGTTFAFSGFVLFQLYNIVFLVGAAWLPLGIALMDRIVRKPSTGVTLGLAAVLSMQILGGDPEVAIITLLIGLPYLLIHHFGRQGFWWGVGLLCLGHAAVFFGRCLPPFEFASEAFVDPTMKTLALNAMAAALKYPVSVATELFDAVRAKSDFPFSIGGKAATVTLYLGWTGFAALIGGFILLLRGGGIRTLRTNALFRTWIAAAVLAGLLSAVQILPTRDLVKVSDRSAPQAPHESAAFSLFPARLLETAVPAVFGNQMPTHTRWAPFFKLENGLWTASLYMGLPAAVLGLLMLRFRRGEAPVVWLSWAAALTLWLAIGKYGGVYWLFDPNYGMLSKPIDAPRDAKLYGVSDGLYRFCEEVVPLFASFRYPEKCFLFVGVALAMLAAFGADRAAELSAKLRKKLAWLAIAGAATALGVWAFRSGVESMMAGFKVHPSGFGPFDPAGGWAALLRSLIHATAVAAALALFARSARPRNGLLLLLLAVDVVVANRWLVLTESQASIDAKPKLLQAIEESEAKEPDPQPYRVHRTRIYSPPAFNETSDSNRIAAMNEWERNTLQPKYGLPWGLAYATTAGTMSVYDVEFFFAPWSPIAPPALQRSPNEQERMTYFPRVGYNLWNAKYFVLPAAQPIDHDERGVFTLAYNADGSRSAKLAESPPQNDDYVLLKNVEAFPRAWIVHDAEVQPPVWGLKRADRQRTMERLLYRGFDGALQIWKGGVEYPLRSRVQIENADSAALMPFITGGPTAKNDIVRFLRDEPGRIEMEADLDRPGFVVISNAYYKGWTATVDGKPAPILRGNRAMQAIPVDGGKHRIELKYSCRSTMIGGVISVAAWLWLGRRLLARRRGDV
jgi:hypothetical protein